VPATAVVDTLKRADGDGRVLRTVERRDLWAVQTPQVFKAAALRAAYARPDVSGSTDDAGVLERAGATVVVVPSTQANVKITTPADLPLAGALLSWETEADV
jgi:2-C-methyl-D-erythritol 4-phosphate cytidylyltransferase